MRNNLKDSYNLNLSSLTAFTVAHFIVDFSCAFLLFRLTNAGTFSANHVWGYFLTYNSLAFGLEFIIGSLFSLRTAWICSCIGCCILGIGLSLGAYIEAAVARHLSPVLVSSLVWFQFASDPIETQIGAIPLLSLLSFILAGIGNAFFHVGGGIDALARNIGQYWRGGVFISSGALGLYAGGRLGYSEKTPFGVVIFLLALAMILIGSWGREKAKNGKTLEQTTVDKTVNYYAQSYYNDWRLSPLFFSIIVVFARSFAGFIAPHIVAFPAEKQTILLGIACFSFGGKFFGGFLADRLGARSIGVVALLLAIPSLCFSNSLSFFLAGIFLLNTTTAVTLLSAAQACVGRVGFAFGLTTLALLCGYLLYDDVLRILDFEKDASLARNVIIASLSISVIGILLSTFSLKKAKNNELPPE